MWSELFKRFVRLGKRVFFSFNSNRLKYGHRSCNLCDDDLRPEPIKEGETLPDGSQVGLGAEDGAIVNMLVEAYDQVGPRPKLWDWVALRVCEICQHGQLSSRTSGARGGYLPLIGKIILVRPVEDVVEVFFEAQPGKDPSQVPRVQTRTAIFLITRFFPDMDKRVAASALRRLEAMSHVQIDP